LSPSLAGSIQSLSAASGVVYLTDDTFSTPDAGPYWGEVRFTFTGGYFFEQLEPEDEGYPTVQPPGSAPLPKGLRLAWLNHCRASMECIRQARPGARR